MDSTTKPEVIETRSQAIDSLDRRTMLKSTVVAAGSLSMPAIVRAQSAPKIRIG